MSGVTTSQSLLHWTHSLTGLEPARVVAAREEIASWGFEHLSRELLPETIDAAVGATLLVEGIRHLVERGAREDQLRKKVRSDREVWGTWAEIRAADILLRTLQEDAEVRLEEGRSQGAHADLRFILPDAAIARSVEVKAIGLSDDEVAFCERMAPALDRLLPRVGLSHAHSPLTAQPPRPSRAMRRAADRGSRRATKQVPKYPRGLRGAVIVGHGSETSYARRIAGRVLQAVRQLPASDECWVGLYWSNGASLRTVRSAIDWTEIPSHVAGIIFVGCGVAFPHRNIDCYASQAHRDLPLDTPIAVQSKEEGLEELAALVLERFERSSGVRPTLLKGGNTTILRRAGERRILPFNLLMDVDPPEVDREAENPPWSR